MNIIDQKVVEKRRNLNDIIEDLKFVLKTIKKENALEEIEQRLNEPYTFMIVGEVNSGKSSFVNALLGSKDLAKVSPQTCTDKINVIEYSEEPYEKELLDKYIKYIGRPIDILKNIRIVDTPGTNSMIVEHEKITESFIPEADLIIFVFPANNIEAGSAWSFFEKIAKKFQKNIIIVLTMKDIAKKEQIEINYQNAKVRAKDKGKETPIFITSSDMEFDGKEDSGFEEIRKFILDTVTGSKKEFGKLESLANQIKALLMEIKEDFYKRKKNLQEQKDIINIINKNIEISKKNSLNEVELWIKIILENYRNISKKVKNKLEEEITLWKLLRRSFSKKENLRNLEDEIKSLFIDELLRTTKEISSERSVKFINNVKNMLNKNLEELKEIEKSIDLKNIFYDFGEQRNKLIDNTINKIDEYIKNEKFMDLIKEEKLKSINSTIFSGTGLSVLGIILMASTQISIFDITGGIITGLGVMTGTVFAAFKKNKIIKKIEKKFDEGEELIKNNLESNLYGVVELIYNDIASLFSEFEANIITEYEKLEELDKVLDRYLERLKEFTKSLGDSMIFTLTMNPCLDRYLYVDKLIPDDTIRVKRIKDYPAGKGIDVSRVIKELGGVSVAIALLGGHNGRRIEEMLDEEGVIYSSIRISYETRMNIILEEKTQYRMSMPGEKVKKEKLQKVFEVLNSLVRENDTVVISGSLPKGVSPDYYTGLIFSLKQWGVNVFFDSDGKNLKAGLEAEPYCIKPNTHELSRLLEKEIDEKNKLEISKYARETLEKYKLQEILVSMGKYGSVYANWDEAYYAYPVELKVESAVGAGDSFLAGYVMKYEEDKMEAFRLANAAGNAAVLTPGTELCRKEDTMRLLPQIKIERL
ncbi:hexose kinase [Marinitoga lauensis]|uniref:hexose kinase n=1 Tax=Marinitoga lauensis TaxID=2201189 RepID=UPI001013BDEE|nr:hexose kinase [Marinitoga lauensis]